MHGTRQSDEALRFAQELRGDSTIGEEELREWVAAITGCEDTTSVYEGEWDPAKHPRGGYPQNIGWFSPAGTSGGQPRTSDPSRWYLPSEEKGTWLGTKGDSKFRLKTPIEVNGKLVREIDYKKGVPVLDKFALHGKTVAIVLTGDNRVDIANAKAAWQKLNPGRQLPPNSVFHHDLLHVVGETIQVGGKKVRVLVGKMQLIPTDVNRLVLHEGSASVARKFYQGLSIDGEVVRQLARDSLTGGKEAAIVARAAKRIKPGQIAKGILPFLGRNVVRAVPIVGTGLAVLEFAENAEAHGVAGAAARAAPVLGDLISAHDLGSDLAKQIRDDADAKLSGKYAEINAPVAEAWDKASKQTIDAFHELAPQIRVTNKYGPNGRVDPHEVRDAMRIYREQMGSADYLKAQGPRDFDFDAAAARAKRELRERLTRASQKDTPQRLGPVY